MSCICDCIGKTIFYAVSVIFQIVGIILICAGLFVLTSYDCTVSKLLYEFFTAIGFPAQEITQSEGGLSIQATSPMFIGLMVSGVVLVILSMFALIGANQKGFSLMKTIAVFTMIVIVLAIMGLAIYMILLLALPADTLPDDMDVVKQILKAQLPDYQPTTGLSADFTIQGAIIDMVQSSFHCCGVILGVNDYARGGLARRFYTKTWNMTLWNGTPGKAPVVPPTCCRTKDEITQSKEDAMSNDWNIGDITSFPTPDSINAPTCFETFPPTAEQVHTARTCPVAINRFLETQLGWVIGISSGVIVLCILLLIGLFSMLCNCGQKKKKSSSSASSGAAEMQVRQPQQPVAHAAPAPFYVPVPMAQQQFAPPQQYAYPGQPVAYHTGKGPHGITHY